MVTAAACEKQLSISSLSGIDSSEEIALNQALLVAGAEPLETGLGKYILPINDNASPSHIIAPVLHKDEEETSTVQPFTPLSKGRRPSSWQACILTRRAACGRQLMLAMKNTRFFAIIDTMWRVSCGLSG